MDNPVSLRAAIDAACLNGPEEIVSAIPASASPVPVIVAAMDAVHAAKDTASAEWLAIGAACAAMVAEHDWFGKGAHAASLSF